MSTDLVPLSTALSYANLTDQVLRVRAVQAAAAYNTPTLVLVLHAYMTTASRKGARTSQKTLGAYTLAVQDFVPWAQSSGVSLLRPGRRDGGRYLSHLQQRPTEGKGKSGVLAASTIAQYTAGVRALYRALNWTQATEAQPFGDVYVPSDPTPGIVKNPPYLSEVDLVLPHCDAPLAALLFLCAHAGLRVSEALSVKANDLQGKTLTVHGKGGKVRRVPLGARTRQALTLLPTLDAAGRYFDWNYGQATYRARKVFTACGCEWRGFHAARKHSGTRLYQATKDFTRVGLFLGHASVDTTRRYVAVQDNDVSQEVEEW
ncbi:site-specific integrase (plasmid) [Deinococcus psychrotolerans]|uniref:Site-specific integrase n=1 Tax=Deinococcus psychrotolerans TaxID=2489213 RepID=A0A3G8YI31_9DEIO|nr:site-specific integrase [Deinococcus psychrotolerans]AZI44912.1 site-specific integrase [Deinococcus psychrotolerans]